MKIKKQIAVAGSSSIRPCFTLALLCTGLLGSIGASLDVFNSPADDAKLAKMEDILVFTDGGRLVTLTNNHHLLPSSCLFKGQASSNRKTGEIAPIDPVTTMIWYIETSRKYQANYLLANARYESLWAYQCSQKNPNAIQADE